MEKTIQVTIVHEIQKFRYFALHILTLWRGGERGREPCRQEGEGGGREDEKQFSQAYAR